MKTNLKFNGLIILMIFLGKIIIAQNCEAYFPMEEGAYLEMKSYDDKDKLTGTSKYTVLQKNVTPDRISITARVESYDKDDKELMSTDLEMYCENDIFYIDMRRFLDEETMKSFEGMEVSMESENMEIPANLQVGQMLNDASITMTMGSGGMTMFSMKVYITNRKVEANEEITTPAGTFNCFKLSYDIETKMMMKVTSRSVDWVAKDVGTVRSETYNSKGKLTGYTLLTDIKL